MSNNEYIEIDSETVNIVDKQTNSLISIINNDGDLIRILKTQEWHVDDGGDVVAESGQMLNNIVWNYFRKKQQPCRPS